MNIIVVGLSHKTASVEVREKLSIPEAQLEEAICHLKGYPHIEEVAIISTCNRLEIYSIVKETEQGIWPIRLRERIRSHGPSVAYGYEALVQEQTQAA